MPSYDITSLNDFIIRQQKDFPYARGELSSLLHHIGTAAKMVNAKIRKAGLVEILGRAGAENPQGEDQQKLDRFADDVFIDALQASGECCGVASEENQDEVIFTEEFAAKGKYVVCIDPLDGSSNIDYNVSVGSIFSIYRRVTQRDAESGIVDFIQAGSDQVAAGYVIYGSSTMLVYTTGNGVNGFTLDPTIGEFCLSHPNMKNPSKGRTYSVNEGNYIKFPDGVKRYIKFCQENDPATGRPYISRYIGSLVSDVHRNLLTGGIFLYPPSITYPSGKLRLVYECNPISFIVEQAGGVATDGHNRILSIKPEALHQRSPFYCGSPEMISRLVGMCC
jgi:fructose-1,6-bisphosphatase I